MAGIVEPPHALMSPEPLARRLERAVRHYRMQAAHNLLDELLASHPPTVVVRDVADPLLIRLAERGDDPGAVRFATSLFEVRLLAHGRGWERINGPSVVLAGAPRQDGVLDLIGLGLGLAERRCRVIYFAAATPTALLREAVREQRAPV